MIKRITAIALVFILVFSSFTVYASSDRKSPFTSAAYVHSRMFANQNIHHGIDVSEWQKKINWTKVRESGVEYAIIRVGYRKVRTGQLREDKYWKRNIEAAQSAGIKIGVYFFSQAVTEREAIAEANYLLKRISGYDISLPVIIDFEFGSGYRLNRLKSKSISQKSRNTNIISAFCERVKEKGYQPMVYANLNTLNGYMYPNTLTSRGYMIWCAQYSRKCDFRKSYTCWQYTSKGRVRGITGSVDCDFWYGDDYMFRENTGVIKTTGLIKAASSDDSITLEWNPMYYALGYSVYRSESYNGKYEKIADVTDARYTDTGLQSGRQYHYMVSAYDSQSEGEMSDSYSASTRFLAGCSGKTLCDSVMRRHPGEDNDTVTMLPTGSDTEILSVTYDASGHMWYYCKAGIFRGYLSSDVVYRTDC